MQMYVILYISSVFVCNIFTIRLPLTMNKLVWEFWHYSALLLNCCISRLSRLYITTITNNSMLNLMVGSYQITNMLLTCACRNSSALKINRNWRITINNKPTFLRMKLNVVILWKFSHIYYSNFKEETEGDKRTISSA